MDEHSAGNLPSTFDDGDAYDLILKDFPYGLDFYVALARAAQGPVLDIACGTGRILLPSLQAGVDIEGAGLVRGDAARRCAQGGARRSVAAAASGRHERLFAAAFFALIMIPFNAFIHNMTQEAQIRCLAALPGTLCCRAAS